MKIKEYLQYERCKIYAALDNTRYCGRCNFINNKFIDCEKICIVPIHKIGTTLPIVKTINYKNKYIRLYKKNYEN